MNNVSALIIVEGEVQGVGYRHFVYHHAQKLGLKGYVKNLYNGNVEVFAEGDRELIEELINLLKVGPGSSIVTNISIDWKPFRDKYKSFHITF